MDTKQDPYVCCLQETHFRPKDTYRLKVRGQKNIFRANGMQKKTGVAILISDKIDLKIKKITRDKEGHYIMIKGSIQEEDIIIVNTYAPNIGAPQYIRQTLTDIKGAIGSNTIIVGDFNTLLTPMVAQTVKHLPVMLETWVQSLGGEDLLEKAMATSSSILAWKIP